MAAEKRFGPARSRLRQRTEGRSEKLNAAEGTTVDESPLSVSAQALSPKLSRPV